MPTGDIEKVTISDEAHEQGYLPNVPADWTDPKTVGEALDQQASAGLKNVVEDLTPQAGGEFDFQGHTAGFAAQSATGDGTTTIDWKLGNKFHFTWSATTPEVFTFLAPSKQCTLTLKMKQHSAGGKNATLAMITWLGTTPVFTDGGASKTIIVTVYWDGTTYWGQASPWET